MGSSAGTRAGRGSFKYVTSQRRGGVLVSPSSPTTSTSPRPGTSVAGPRTADPAIAVSDGDGGYLASPSPATDLPLNSPVRILFDVKGKVVLVTGGSRGVGKMIATGFVKNGAKVYISSRSAKDCAATADELNALGPGTCLPLPADMQKLEEVERLVKELGAREKALHVLVNNAGAAWGATLDDYPDAAWSKLLTLNLQRVFTLTQKCLPLLRAAAEQGGLDGDAYRDPARIINIGSVEGLSVPNHETYAYSASKAGLHHLSRHLAGRLGCEGITSNTLACGPFESKMMAQTLREHGEIIRASIPLGRIGTAEDVAGAAIFLASRAGAWVNGATIQVDGGSLVHMGISAPSPKL